MSNSTSIRHLPVSTIVRSMPNTTRGSRHASRMALYSLDVLPLFTVYDRDLNSLICAIGNARMKIRPLPLQAETLAQDPLAQIQPVVTPPLILLIHLNRISLNITPIPE